MLCKTHNKASGHKREPVDNIITDTGHFIPYSCLHKVHHPLTVNIFMYITDRIFTTYKNNMFGKHFTQHSNIKLLKLNLQS